jgi:hypothetical protein
VDLEEGIAESLHHVVLRVDPDSMCLPSSTSSTTTNSTGTGTGTSAGRNTKSGAAKNTFGWPPPITDQVHVHSETSASASASGGGGGGGASGDGNESSAQGKSKAKEKRTALPTVSASEVASQRLKEIKQHLLVKLIDEYKVNRLQVKTSLSHIQSA